MGQPINVVDGSESVRGTSPRTTHGCFSPDYVVLGLGTTSSFTSMCGGLTFTEKIRRNPPAVKVNMGSAAARSRATLAGQAGGPDPMVMVPLWARPEASVHPIGRVFPGRY